MKKQKLTEKSTKVTLKKLKSNVKRNYFNSTCCNHNSSSNPSRSSHKPNNRAKWNI